MADNTTLNPGAGGDTVREVDKGGIKTQVILLDIGGLGAESLFTGSITITSSALPAGAATSANQATEIASLSNLDVLLSTRTKPADQQHAIVDSSALPAGAATAARQDTGNTSLASIDGKITAVNTGAIVFASPQHVIVDSGSITANAGTNLNTSALALEAGNLATLAAKDFATQTTLAFIKARTDNIPPVGQALSAASMPVVIASDQSAFAVTATSAATASSIPPSYSEGVSNALRQTLTGDLRTSDRGFNSEMLSETNDLLRILVREIWSLRMGFIRELRDMPDPSELDFHNPENLLN